ncbi:MAG: Cpe/LpqF family protein [Acidimicrobiales bacterium]
MENEPGRAAVLWPTLVAVAASVGIVVWAIAAHSGTERPRNDDLDVLAGSPDPDRSIAENHLAWALEVINGSDLSVATVSARFSPGFLASIGPDEFIAETAFIAENRPYRLYGIDTDESGTAAAALISDRTGETYALTVAGSPTDPTRIDGLLVTPVEVGRGPFSAGELAIRAAAGLGVIGIGALLSILTLRRDSIWVVVGGLLCTAQLLEIASHRLPYTLGLLAGPLAIAALAVAALGTGPSSSYRWPRRTLLALVGAATAIALLPLSAIDTAAVSLPDQLLFVSGDGDRARYLISLSGWTTGAACGAVVLALLLQQFRADWTRDRGLVTTTLGCGVAATLVAVPAVSAALDLGHVDLSQPLTLPVAAVVASVGIAGTVFWSRYDLGPVAAELEAENTLLHSELANQLAAVRASRARIVHAGDEARRRIERDLHDGAQQRLVAMRVSLQLERRRVGSDHELNDFFERLDRDLEDAVVELRELSRGLHPAILERGVAAAAQSLAETCSVPVEVIAAGEVRCPSDVEHAAYFVISEALANAGRHSSATLVTVGVEHEKDELRITVCDDGVGGAKAGGGAGLVNLEDRVLALGGSWHLHSPQGVGTTIEVRLPCA